MRYGEPCGWRPLLSSLGTGCLWSHHISPSLLLWHQGNFPHCQLVQTFGSGLTSPHPCRPVPSALSPHHPYPLGPRGCEEGPGAGALLAPWRTAQRTSQWLPPRDNTHSASTGNRKGQHSTGSFCQTFGMEASVPRALPPDHCWQVPHRTQGRPCCAHTPHRQGHLRCPRLNFLLHC